jgi:SprT protein
VATNVGHVQLSVKLKRLIRSKFNLDFLPKDFQNLILSKIKLEKVHFRISSPRKSKLGDYKHNFRTGSNSISVNLDLSEIQFMITFLHELAHKKCYDFYKGKVNAHGLEWKALFVELLVEAKDILVLGAEAEAELNKVILKPKATSNPIDDGGLKVKEIKVNDCFELGNGRRFKLIKKRRTRFLCSDLSTGKLYAVSGEATVNQLLD